MREIRTHPTNQLRSYFELVRVFLTPTAVADSFAGYVLAARLFGVPSNAERLDAERLGFVCAVSVAIYWFGMICNDLFDLPKDRAANVNRPIVQGRVSVRGSIMLAVVLGAAALAMAAYLGALIPALALVALVCAYDFGGKRIPVVGNILMGSCRSGNLLIGAYAAAGSDALTSSTVIAAAAILGVYIAGVTAVSLLEDSPFDARRLAVSAAPLFLTPCLLAALNSSHLFNVLNSIVLVVLLGSALNTARRVGAANAAGRSGQELASTVASTPAEDTPAAAREIPAKESSTAEPVANTAPHGAAIFVRQSLGGLFLVDAGCLMALSPSSPTGTAAFDQQAAILYALFALGWAWKRRWIRQGSQGS